LGNRYEIGDLIGRGGMAQVHLGYDTRLSRTVAIKVLRTDLAADPMFLARFRREAQSAAALNHPSIVSVYDTGEETMDTPTGQQISLPYIVMEYVRGRTVAALLSDGEPVPLNDAVQIVVGVLSALEYSHHEGIIHRDIKPGNVMITPDGKIKVMDFGIARAIADSAATMTQTNSVVGTAQYLSPEQARGEVVDTRSDLYSTGCLLYELLTGKPPFTGDSAVAVAYQHVSETPKLASEVHPEISEEIDRVVMKSLAKRREDRYQNAAEFRNDLLAAARGEGVNAPAATAWDSAPVVPPGGTQVASAQEYYPPSSAATSATTATGVQPAVASSEKVRRKNRLMVWLGVAFLAIAGVAVAIAMNMGGGDSSTAKVPTMAEMDESRAKATVEKAGFKFSKGDDQASSSVKKGLFVSSSPKPGSSLEKGKTVTVHFSSGPSAQVTVPDVTGMTQEKATAALEKVGLKTGNVTTINSSDVAKNTVAKTSPAAGETAESGSQVELYIAAGGTKTPDVIGKTAEQAESDLQNAGFKSTVVYQRVSSPNQDGKVLVQRRSGNTVTITVGRYTSEPSAPTDPTGGRQQTTYPYPRSTTTPAAPPPPPAAPPPPPARGRRAPPPSAWSASPTRPGVSVPWSTCAPTRPSTTPVRSAGGWPPTWASSSPAGPWPPITSWASAAPASPWRA